MKIETAGTTAVRKTRGAVEQLLKLVYNASEEAGEEVLKETDISKLVLYNTKEFCELQGISRRTAYEWRRDGTISYLRIQGKIYYRLYDILNDMDELSFKNDPLINKK